MRLVLADERLLLRPREQGAVHRMIDEGEARLLAAGFGDQLVAAVLEPFDQANPAPFLIAPESCRYVAGADSHLRRFRGHDADQCVAAGHELGAR
jgi:hypothetical protein